MSAEMNIVVIVRAAHVAAAGVTVAVARVDDRHGLMGHSGSGLNTCTSTRTARIAAITRRQ
jgi:hypothetical protein